MADSILIRRAVREDAPILLDLIEALADYEKLPRPTPEARERLIRDGFGERPRFEAFLAELGGQTVGYAFIFETYSSFLALPTLYLEDIFVMPQARRQGVGKALFEFCAGEAARRGCGRMEWVVLDWNKPAIDFYRRYGAQALREWCLFRLTAEQLRVLVK
ncbi:MAG: GNAT family N-acetyltransferase [candidate division KSB1 bacterium]|nr:GNAT family N-acetyltransferase [candidate division KSB1 bacterium]